MPKLDLRKGITDPVVLLVSKRQVEEFDIDSVLQSVKVFSATREDAWLYRGQVTIAVSGYEADSRELLDIPEVRKMLSAIEAQWRHWPFFINQVDHSISLLLCSVCGVEFPGKGQVVVDPALLPGFLQKNFNGLNELFDRHGFPESELEAMSNGFTDIVLDGYA